MNRLHFAAYQGDLSATIDCLSDKIDVNATDDNGYTALHWLCDMAATGGQRIDILNILLKNGADASLKTAGGDTAKFLALAATSDIGDKLADLLTSKTAVS